MLITLWIDKIVWKRFNYIGRAQKQRCSLGLNVSVLCRVTASFTSLKSNPIWKIRYLWIGIVANFFRQIDNAYRAVISKKDFDRVLLMLVDILNTQFKCREGS